MSASLKSIIVYYHMRAADARTVRLLEETLIYKYNILERVLVENIIPRNVSINRGAAEVDNHISRDDFFD